MAKGDIAFDFFELLHSEGGLDFGNKGIERRQTLLTTRIVSSVCLCNKPQPPRVIIFRLKYFQKPKKVYIQFQYSR